MARSPIFVAVAGGSGSGKSTLVEQLYMHFCEQASLIKVDDYYHDRSDLSLDERALLDYDSPDSLDLGLLVSHLDQLRNGEAVDIPQYDFDSHTRKSQRVKVDANRWILIDGILVLADDRVRSRMDFSVYVDASEDVRLARRLARDMRSRGRSRESVMAQWEMTVKPNHDRFVEVSKRHASYVVSGEGTTATSEVVRCLEKLTSTRFPTDKFRRLK